MIGRLMLAGIALIAATCAVAQPAPPTIVQMPTLGTVDPATGLLRSFDSGRQPVGTGPLFREWVYQFNLEAGGEGRQLSGSVEEGSNFNATIELQDANRRTIGPLTGSLPNLPSGTYYIRVTATVPTSFHFGVVALPRLADYPNDAGRTKDSALDLGALSSEISRRNNFYTYFPRRRISQTNDPATGPLIPDFLNPTPYEPSPHWYRFTLAFGAEIKLTGDSVRAPGETYILTNLGGISSYWSKGQTRLLDPSTYWIAVVDQVTQVLGVGIGGFSFSRNTRIENFEHYDFQLVVAPSGRPGNNPGTVDLTTTIDGINTNRGLGGFSSVTGAGGTVAVTYRINNRGVPASAAGNVAFYISQTPQLTPQSRFIVYGQLVDTVPAMGSLSAGTVDIVLPAGLRPGRYYLIAVANFDRLINEADFANNASNPASIEIR